MNSKATLEKSKSKEKEKAVKCLVWDLDNTLWNGTIIENDKVTLKDGVVDVIKEVDRRGILQSIASKNNFDHAYQKLKEFGLSEYFLYPQIHWSPKSESIKTIAKSINIGLDTMAFIDDQRFELDEVKYNLENVTCYEEDQLYRMLDFPEMNPRFVTEDSKNRRLMYMNDIQRNKIEDTFTGPKEDFLASLDMHFTIAKAREDDLKRAEELTERTNQLNTTGYTYSHDELNILRQSSDYKLLIASLDDKYGSYGKIGLCLLECRKTEWTIKLLLMSCRVMSRGVGNIMINYILNEAKKNGVRLLSEFVENDRNRMMYVTYKFAGFKEIQRNGNHSILENDLNQIQPYPDYVKLTISV
jgi:FkbH-like protein